MLASDFMLSAAVSDTDVLERVDRNSEKELVETLHTSFSGSFTSTFLWDLSESLTSERHV